MSRGLCFCRELQKSQESRPAAKNTRWRIEMIRSRVREWAVRHALLPQGSNIVAACPGGPDSLALVDLLDGLRQDLHFNLFIAHFDHGLRGEDSTRDADFVRQFCASRKLPFRTGGADVRGEVHRRGGIDRRGFPSASISFFVPDSRRNWGSPDCNWTPPRRSGRNGAAEFASRQRRTGTARDAAKSGVGSFGPCFV